MAKNSTHRKAKHRKARLVTARKIGVYRSMAASMEVDYVPQQLVGDLQNDPDFRAALRQRGAIVEKKDGKFVVVPPRLKPIKGS
jgi:hypothetical protein